LTGNQAFSGERLKELRTLAAMSREQLALASRLSYASINSYECGWRRPQPKSLNRLAAALGIDPVELTDKRSVTQ
jgi:transcriptional regulator with XRE-family HTH domain